MPFESPVYCKLFNRSWHEIAETLKSVVFVVIIIDETTDMTNKKQIVLVFCLEDDNLVAHEELNGPYLI